MDESVLRKWRVLPHRTTQIAPCTPRTMPACAVPWCNRTIKAGPSITKHPQGRKLILKAPPFNGDAVSGGYTQARIHQVVADKTRLTVCREHVKEFTAGQGGGNRTMVFFSMADDPLFEQGNVQVRAADPRAHECACTPYTACTRGATRVCRAWRGGSAHMRGSLGCQGHGSCTPSPPRPRRCHSSDKVCQDS